MLIDFVTSVIVVFLWLNYFIWPILVIIGSLLLLAGLRGTDNKNKKKFLIWGAGILLIEVISYFLFDQVGFW